jgi:TrmH family RNA methyltransferase
MELQQVGIHHPSIKRLVAIQKNTAPNPRRLFVAEGLWANKVLLRAGTAIDTFLWCPEAAYSDDARTTGEQLADHAERAYRISLKTLEKVAERERPDGLVCIARMPTWDANALELDDSALVLVADGIEIPGNLGTIIRTLEACQADCLLLTNRRTRLTHPKVFRASQGTSVLVPTIEFEQPEQAIAWLEAQSFMVYLADTDAAKNYRSCDYRGRTALVVGSERYGISRPWYDSGFPRVFVPMLGIADSLNVSISASVLLYEARAQKNGW